MRLAIAVSSHVSAAYNSFTRGSIILVHSSQVNDAIMVLGLLMIAALPTTIGVAEGISSRNKQTDAANDEELMRKFTLECFCDAQSRKRVEIHGRRIYLRNEKLYIARSPPADSFPFTGFYVSYPDPERTPTPLGMVSFVSSDPPALNWMYVDKETRQLRYGNRTQSIAHHVGQWGFEAGEEGGAGGVTFDGDEGAVAVETSEGWEIRWEDENGSVGETGGRRVLSISLERKFVEEPKDAQKEETEVEKKPAGQTDGKLEVSSTTVQKEKGSNEPATKT